MWPESGRFASDSQMLQTGNQPSGWIEKLDSRLRGNDGVPGAGPRHAFIVIPAKAGIQFAPGTGFAYPRSGLQAGSEAKVWVGTLLLARPQTSTV